MEHPLENGTSGARVLSDGRGSADAVVQWVSLTCPHCKSNLRIKAAYAHLRGRCPECGCRIEPVRPQRGKLRASSTAGEPLGLVPIEEEWPEPARLENERSTYSVAAGPIPSAPTPPPPVAVSPEVYDLANDELPARPPLVSDPPLVSNEITLADIPSAPTVEGPSLAELYREKHLDRVPTRIPTHPLWEGIYTFPWQPANLGVWLFLTLDFGMIAVLITIMGMIYEVREELEVSLILLVVPATTLAWFWTGTYASGCFLALVEETAAGGHDISWPDGANIIEGLWKFLYLNWLSACCLIPGLAFWVLGPHLEWADRAWWALPAISWVICFPLLLFSSLAGARWVPLDWRVLWGLLRRPQALFLMYVPLVAAVTICGGLGIWIFLRPSFLQAAWIGLVWSAALIIYGRALGRAGWIITYEGTRKRPRARKPGSPSKKERGAVLLEGGWGGEDDAEERTSARKDSGEEEAG
jgi:hypothetical protein